MTWSDVSNAMGLLTNPNSTSSPMIVLLQNHSAKLAWLLYFAGIAAFLAFASPQYAHKTYFSENALLPGLVHGEFNEEKAIKRYFIFKI